MDRGFELQRKLQEAEQAQINAIHSDTADGTLRNWRILRKVLGIVWPAGLKAERAGFRSSLVEGYILALREALGIQPDQGAYNVTAASKIKDKFIEFHNPPRNPWAEPEAYIGATWAVIPMATGIYRGPVWH